MHISTVNVDSLALTSHAYNEKLWNSLNNNIRDDAEAYKDLKKHYKIHVHACVLRINLKCGCCVITIFIDTFTNRIIWW